MSTDNLLTLKKAGNNIGLAYQIQDDVCDNENINFWQDSIERENHLKGLKDQILADLTSILPLSPAKNQLLIQLVTALFANKPIENNYQVDERKIISLIRMGLL